MWHLLGGCGWGMWAIIGGISILDGGVGGGGETSFLWSSFSSLQDKNNNKATSSLLLFLDEGVN